MSSSPDPTGPRSSERPPVDDLLPVVYDELRKVASGFFRREATGHTLQPTALVHEAYVRLVRGGTIPMASHRQFLAVAAHAIRQVLVDHARGKRTDKRGGDWRRISIDEDLAPSADGALDVLAVDEALDRLAALNERQARVVELRFFAGLGEKEVGEVLGVSERTVRGDWQVARAWLRRELGTDAT